ncbi:synaptotagmin-2-like isoform X2 [Dendronephthya gigantea]|uniref:synaptotagmin-2-like isoform X2 n=1 Tax=Dendronephthya gigantea TaxID=151771 RepID=UPI00106B3123|nr:synaptotagmin-2-like isoform X2 [Dendronephthya gigantea]
MFGINKCLNWAKDDSKKNRKIINMDNEAHVQYSFEVVQPEMVKQSNADPFPNYKSYTEQPKRHNRMFQSILNGAVDSADEMSFIYDVYSETETDQEKRTKAITTRFAKYLDNVPGNEPMILLSLNYIKDGEILVMAVIKIANLKPITNEIIDPFVRVDVWIKDMVILKKKTVVVKQELNPVFNQKMEVSVSNEDIQDVRIRLTIANYCPSLDEPQYWPVPLHKLEVGARSTGSCWEHWIAAMKTNKPIAKWHVLL